MKVTEFTRQALAFRRQKRDLEKQGYRQSEANQWEIHRGGWDNREKKIVDAKISVCGKYVYTRVA